MPFIPTVKIVWNKLSLRIKLTLLYVTLLTLLLSILGISLYLDDKNFLITSLEKRIRAQAKPVIAHWLYYEINPPPLLGTDNKKIIHLKNIAPFLARDLTSKDTGAVIINIKGKIIARGKILKEEPSCPPPNKFLLKKALSGKNEIDYFTYFKGQHILVTFIPLRKTPKSSEIYGVVELATPLTQIDKILERKAILLITSILIALLLGSILGLYLTTSVLKDLSILVSTCEAIASGNLTKRVGLHYKRKDEIGRLSQAFDDMADKIQKVFLSQKRFIAKAAHEFRTPITAILGSSEVLLRGSIKDPKSLDTLIRGIYKEANRLWRLCERLLDISRIDASKNIQKQKISIKELVEDAINNMQNGLRGQKLYITAERDVDILVDPELFTLLLLNLIDNAIKHTKENDIIEIGWEKENNKYIKIWVKDTGEGIEPKDLPHIFEPFYQGKKDKKKGSGLGLSLVKEIVESHGGKIEVKSNSTETIFFITLSIN